MSGINWNLLQIPDIGGNALAAFDKGRQTRRAEDSRNALATLMQNPDDEAAFGQLAQADPEMAMGWQKQRTDQQADQQRKQQEQIPLMGKLLTYAKQGPQQWAQALQQAQAMGLDVSQVPQQHDPAWAEQQLGFINAMGTPEGQQALSSAGKMAMDMGFKPGTPEFAARVQQIFTTQESKPYVVGGETRLYTPKLGGAGESVGSASPAHIAALKANPERAAEFDAKFGPGSAARILGQGGPQVAPAGGFRP